MTEPRTDFPHRSAKYHDEDSALQARLVWKRSITRMPPFGSPTKAVADRRISRVRSIEQSHLGYSVREPFLSGIRVQVSQSETREAN